MLSRSLSRQRTSPFHVARSWSSTSNNESVPRHPAFFSPPQLPRRRQLICISMQQTRHRLHIPSHPPATRASTLPHPPFTHDIEKSQSATPKSHSHDQWITRTQRSSTPALERHSPVNPHAWNILTNMILEDRSVLRDRDLVKRLSRVIYHTAPASPTTLSLR